jgi:hypothetical protein
LPMACEQFFILKLTIDRDQSWTLRKVSVSAERL